MDSCSEYDDKWVFSGMYYFEQKEEFDYPKFGENAKSECGLKKSGQEGGNVKFNNALSWFWVLLSLVRIIQGYPFYILRSAG